jgi:hypothetical protein
MRRLTMLMFLAGKRDRVVTLDLSYDHTGIPRSFWARRIAEAVYQDRVDALHFRAYPDGPRVTRSAKP